MLQPNIPAPLSLKYSILQNDCLVKLTDAVWIYKFYMPIFLLILKLKESNKLIFWSKARSACMMSTA